MLRKAILLVPVNIRVLGGSVFSESCVALLQSLLLMAILEFPGLFPILVTSVVVLWVFWPRWPKGCGFTVISATGAWALHQLELLFPRKLRDLQSCFDLWLPLDSSWSGILAAETLLKPHVCFGSARSEQRSKKQSGLRAE